MPSRKIIGAAAMTAAIATGGLLGATLGTPGTSGAQDGTTTTAPADGTPPAPNEDGPGHGGKGFGGGADLDAAATALDLTVDELRTRLQDGQSLADVAEAEGIDRQQVVDALVAAGEARLDEARAALPERVAELVDGTLPLGGPGGAGGPGRGGPGGRGPDHEAAATALGLTVDELRTRLQDGESLAEVADAEGVDRTVLVDALVAAQQERLDQAVADGDLTQAEADERSAELADRITEGLDEVHPGGERGHHGPGDGAEDDTTTTAPAEGD